jgi:hypothetical protein
VAAWLQQKNPLLVKHKYGTTYVANSPIISLVPMPVPSVKARFEAKSRDIRKNKPTSSDFLELAEWALSHGLVKEFTTVMEDLAKADANHPAVVAFAKVKAALEKTPGDDTAEVWQQKLLRDYKIVRKGHYALLHNYATNDAPEVHSRLHRLEDNFQTFFYWFALKARPGITLPEVPANRLVSVLVAQEEQFERQHQIFDSTPMVADGFLARRDNLPVFSATRLDPGYSAVARTFQSAWLLWDRETILTTPANKLKPPGKVKAEEFVQMLPHIQTMALLQKALEEDSELASVSHEASRQLIAASGLLPPSVVAPEWLEFGMGAFFETPKGSPWVCVGAPSPTFMEDYNYLLQYKKARTGKYTWKLEKQPLVDLKAVITDQYFQEARDIQNSKEPDDTRQPKERTARNKARSLAWTLTYFLAHKELDGLMRYYKELAKLPRDLEFDDEVLLGCFARAFNCADPSRPNRVDEVKLAQLANKWSDFINLTPTEGEKIMEEAKKNQSELSTPGTTPSGGIR